MGLLLLLIPELFPLILDTVLLAVVLEQEDWHPIRLEYLKTMEAAEVRDAVTREQQEVGEEEVEEPLQVGMQGMEFLWLVQVKQVETGVREMTVMVEHLVPIIHQELMDRMGLNILLGVARLVLEAGVGVEMEEQAV